MTMYLRLSLLDITNWKEKIKYLEIKPHIMLVRDKEVFFKMKVQCTEKNLSKLLNSRVVFFFFFERNLRSSNLPALKNNTQRQKTYSLNPVLRNMLITGGQFSCSVMTLCDPMNCSTPGFLALYSLPDFTQTHVHWVSDAIKPSYPLLPPSPPALNLSHHQGLFRWVGCQHQVAKVLEIQLQHQFFHWIFRVDFL